MGMGCRTKVDREYVLWTRGDGVNRIHVDHLRQIKYLLTTHVDVLSVICQVDVYPVLSFWW